MKLYEYEAKRILNSYGMTVPCGQLAETPQEARAVAKALRPPFVVKAQILTGGRGKAGGILFAESLDEVEDLSKKLLGTRINDVTVRKLLVEEKVPMVKELYIGLTVDRIQRTYIIMAASLGGIDVEHLAVKFPESLIKLPIYLKTGFNILEGKQIAAKLSYQGPKQQALAEAIVALYNAGIECDAELVEVNPLIETPNGHLITADARLNVDDNSLFRHPELDKKRFAEEREKSSTEIKAGKKGLVYIDLEGNIGVVGNGAGLVMATLDLIQLYGGKPADFLDLGGGAPIERISAAMEILFSNPAVKVVLVNILGGMTRCDDVARAIIQVKESSLVKPLVIRLIGTNEVEGKRILEESGITVLNSIEEAAKRAVAESRGA